MDSSLRRNDENGKFERFAKAAITMSKIMIGCKYCGNPLNVERT
jgi:hypothetical protein